MPEPTAVSTQQQNDISAVKVKTNNIPKNIKIVNERGNNLNKDDFLKLLLTQLTKQDPLQPVNDREFIAQMAQFSSLEQMQNVAENVQSMKSLQVHNFIGREITGKDFITGKITAGVVEKIIYDGTGAVFLKTENSTIRLEDMTSIGSVKSEQNNSPSEIPSQNPIPKPVDEQKIPEQVNNQDGVSRETTQHAETEAMINREAIKSYMDGYDKQMDNDMNNQNIMYNEKGEQEL